MTPNITLIAIVANDGAIGRGGDQPFHISADFKHFKALTLGKPILMGRNTFEALPSGALPGRRNIVITRNSDWTAPGVETAPSIEKALELCRDTEEVMVIGGGQIYKAAMPMATRLEITLVDAKVPDADTFFPAIDPTIWQLKEQSEPMTDPRTMVMFRFLTYIPK
ncbi:MAG: dihydrofolate reductase [Paramuribaculum sp.]|nr:dihydrofolate reductase [Paramuribaculum sp.]